jgi:DNA-binding response OmpR family regulator
MRILLVDDHQDSLRAMTRRLSQCGHEVTTAATLTAARAMCNALVFDLVICDVRLPDGDGRELVALARRRGAKVISISGLDVEDLWPGWPGFDANVMKPISFELLESTINRVMRGAGHNE